MYIVCHKLLFLPRVTHKFALFIYITVYVIFLEQIAHNGLLCLAAMKRNTSVSFNKYVALQKQREETKECIIKAQRDVCSNPCIDVLNGKNSFNLH